MFLVSILSNFSFQLNLSNSSSNVSHEKHLNLRSERSLSNFKWKILEQSLNLSKINNAETRMTSFTSLFWALFLTLTNALLHVYVCFITFKRIQE